MNTQSAYSIEPLFQPFSLRSKTLRNRIVMSPMTRCFSPRGVPGPDMAGYYRRRAEADVGLIITEGTGIDHPFLSKVTPVTRPMSESEIADVIASYARGAANAKAIGFDGIAIHHARGHYRETYAFEEGCWRIASLHLTRTMIDVLEGSARAPS
jgi:2,4-dienoyl-CoA reductase-like NADH-dependent reductase (Old Yellow Enzyme family)